ncbi:MAG: hypothetical protein R2879_03185 [Saprospiraceae bacterium]
MGFACHVFDMIKRMEANRKMMRGNQAFSDPDKINKSIPEEYGYNKEFGKDFSEEQKLENRTKINAEISNENKGSIYWTLGFIVVVLIVLIFTYQFLG